MSRKAIRKPAAMTRIPISIQESCFSQPVTRLG
jgi:hypothetical protein